MKKKRLSLLLLLLISCLTLSLPAQTLTGRMVDADGEPLPMVIINLMRTGQPRAVSQAVSGLEGEFELPCPQDTAGVFLYTLCTGYESQRLPLPASGTSLGEVRMMPVGHLLGEAQATGRRLRTTMRGYSVDLRGDIRAQGTNAHDVLVLLPQVTQNVQGDILVNGKPVREIYINDMPLKGGLAELKAIPGLRIDSVEVQTLLDASHTSDDKGGVLRLHLARLPKGGYYGMLSAGGQSYVGYGKMMGTAGGFVSYRRGKLNFYDAMSVDGGWGVMDEYDATEDADGNLKQEDYTWKRHKNLSFSNHASLGVNLADRQFLGLSYYVEKSDVRSSLAADYADAAGPTYTSMRRDSTDECNHELTLRYTGTLGQRSHRLEVMADYLHRSSSVQQLYTTTGMAPDVAQPYASRDYADMFYGKADWTMPLGGKWGHLQAGMTYRYVMSKLRPADAETSGGDWFEGRRYAVNIRTSSPVVYAAWSGRVAERMSYYAGLNYEQSHLDYEPLVGLGIARTWRSLNPTVRLGYTMSREKGNEISLTYKRVMSGVPYSMVNPNRTWVTPELYSVGNPDLQAGYRHTLYATLSLLQSQLTLMAGGSVSQDDMTYVTLEDAERPGVYYSTPVNMGGRQYGTFLSGEYGRKLAPWWYGKVGMQLSCVRENTTLDGVPYDGWNAHTQFYTQHQFVFRKNWNVLLFGHYEPTYTIYNDRMMGVGFVRATLSKYLLNDRLGLSLDGSVGKQRTYYRSIRGGEVQVYKNRTHPCKLVFSLTWRFSGGRKVQVEQVDKMQEYQISNDSNVR